jgi:hypothetical protein
MSTDNETVQTTRKHTGPYSTIDGSWLGWLKSRFQRDPESIKPRRIEQSLGDAALLLDFAVHGSRKIDIALITRVNHSLSLARQAGFRDDNISTQVGEGFLLNEQAMNEFWLAFDELSVLMAPVSAESIRASQAEASKPLGALVWYVILAIFCFVLFLYWQFTWVVGNRYLVEVREAYATKVVKDHEWRTLSLDVERLEKAVGLGPDEDTAGVSAAAADEVKQRRSKRDAALAEYNDADGTLRSRLPMLTFWRHQHSCHDPMKSLGDCIHNLTGRDEKDKDKPSATAGDSELGTPFFNRDQVATDMVGIATPMVERLNAHVIPVLLGLLGALVFIIRNLIEQIRSRTLVRHFWSGTLARVCLGMIGGVVGGLLFADSDKQTALSAIPPIALPFFFGYAVEVVFAFLDRIVKAFTTDPTPASSRQ